MNTAQRFPRALYKNLSRLTIACLALFSIASSRAQSPWLNETFSGYTNGQTLTNTLSPQLINNGNPTNFTKITNNGSANIAQYQKTASGTGSYVMFALSATNSMVARASGYVSFKVNQNINPAVGTSGKFFLGIGNSVYGTSISASTNRYVTIQFSQSGSASNSISVESGGASIVNSFPYAYSTSFPLVHVWFNDSDTAAMTYTNPLNATSTLGTNSFVVYIGTNLVTTTNSGNAPLYGGTNISGAGIPATGTNIGKMGFGATSVNTVDYSFASLYAADSAPGLTTAPAITSATNATAYVGIPFAYQITTDPPGATSYALTGTLPDGLAFNSTNGTISGTPTTVGGPATVALTASNSVGTGAPVNLAITVSLPVNVFSGTNPSLNTPASWSLGSTPTASANPGSFTDLVFNSTETNLTTTSGNVYGKSWNVTNGGSYTFSSLAASQTSFKLGNTGTNDTYPYSNAVAGAANVMLWLTNGSKLTLSPNNGGGGSNSVIQLRNSGILLIEAGSVADFQAPLSSISATNALTKAGNGTLILSASNSCAGGIVISNGTVNATAASSLGSGTIALGGGYMNATADNAWNGSKDLGISGGTALFSGSNNYTGVTTLSGGTLQLSNAAALGGSNTTGTFVLAGGTVEALADYDLGHTFGTLTNNGTNSWVKLDGETTTISGPVTLNAAPGVTLALYKLAGTTNSANVVTKTGLGTLQLRGGGVPSVTADWLINSGTLFVNTTASGGLGTNNSVIMNGGNILFSKGVGSSGTYSGQGQDVGLQVRQNGTVTLNPNTNTPPGANTVSFTNLVISNQTLSVVKGPEAFCSTNPGGYTDPQLTFKAATFDGTAALVVGTNVETVIQAGSGSGGVTKSGAGKLTISADINGVQNTYTGATVINAGTLELDDTNASSVIIASNAVLESVLSVSGWPVTTGSLTFSNGAKVRIAGTPTLTNYTLISGANITGSPVLETAVPGYQLTVSGNSLLLTSASASSAVSVVGSFTAFNTTAGVPSAAQTVTASGSGLTADLTVTPPAGYEVSTNGTTYSASISLAPSGGTVASTTIYVRLTGAAAGSFSGNVSFASTGATPQDLPVSGTVATAYASWASGYGLTGSNAATTADPDSDGFNNNNEYCFDGNPTNSTPYLFKVTAAGTNAVFNWIERNSGVTYQVQTNSTLTNVWTGPAAVTVSNSANQSGVLLTNDYTRKEFTAPSSGKNFYRVKATVLP